MALASEAGAASERRQCGAAFPGGVSCAVLAAGCTGARHGAFEMVVALGTEMRERPGPCGRSEHQVSPGLPRNMRERRCKARDAVNGVRSPWFIAPPGWSGRPCCRSRENGCAQTELRRRRHGCPRGRCPDRRSSERCRYPAIIMTHAAFYFLTSIPNKPLALNSGQKQSAGPTYIDSLNSQMLKALCDLATFIVGQPSLQLSHSFVELTHFEQTPSPHHVWRCVVRR